jgi:hypothetical protein
MTGIINVDLIDHMGTDLTAIAWAAGIIEGEGCFSMFQRKDRANTMASHISVEMTDEDIIRRLHKVLGVGTITGPHTRKRKDQSSANRKPTWIWTAHKKEDQLDTLIKIGPYLGSRRKEKAIELFKHLEERILG